MSKPETSKLPNTFGWICARFLFYPTLILNMFLVKVVRTRNWYDQVDEYVILGALPSRKDVSELKKIGVSAVLNLCDEYSGPEEAYREAGLVQLRLPTIDYASPSLETVKRGVEFIEYHVAQGNKVYVHCKAGRGRSATVILCWLVKAKKIKPLEAMDILLERRPHVNKRLHQRSVVREFIEIES